MSFFYTLLRILRSGATSFFRNGTLTFASVLMLVVSLSVATSLLFFGVVIDGIVAELRDKVDMSVYFKRDAPEEEILAVKQSLEQFSAVTGIEYVSRDVALEHFKEQHQNNSLLMASLAELGDNPLEASLNIKAKEASQYAALNGFLEGKFGSLIEKVNYRENEAAITRLFSVTSALERAGIAVSIAFFFVAMLVAFNTIRLAIHELRGEISIMRLVGASNWFIRGPFVVQGVLNGLFAAVFTLGIFAAVAYAVTPPVAHFIGRVNLWEYYQANMAKLFLLQAGLGIGIGVFSSLIAIRRHLRV